MSEQTLEELHNITRKAIVVLRAAEDSQRSAQDANDGRSLSCDRSTRQRLHYELVRANAKLRDACEAASTAIKAYEKRIDFLRAHPSRNGAFK